MHSEWSNWKGSKKRVARLAGIEPSTPWFVAMYSIHLSYSRAKRQIISLL